MFLHLHGANRRCFFGKYVQASQNFSFIFRCMFHLSKFGLKPSLGWLHLRSERVDYIAREYAHVNNCKQLKCS